MQNAESYRRAAEHTAGSPLAELSFVASMMALNAAIEPATPVQPGMGFRAAAEQVRSLVHREGGRN